MVEEAHLHGEETAGPEKARRFMRPGRVVAAGGNGRSRWELPFGGTPLFFESEDIALAGAGEAFASALLPAAVMRGHGLWLDDAVDEAWRRNVRAILPIWAGWWGTPTDLDELLKAPRAVAPAAARGPTSALCFTGGVDSFHSLLRGATPPDMIVFVTGFDVHPGDAARLAPIATSLRDIAAETGVRAITLRTNLRVHPLYRGVNWERTHGGALAAIGHLLKEHIAELRVSASYPHVFDRPWGSHFRTDPHWSSAAVTIAHVGGEKWRAEKLLDLADEPLVRRHLRVCWENRAPQGNCGECEKCLRTQLILAGRGLLDNFPAFAHSRPLFERIAAVARLAPDLLPVYANFLKADLDRATAAAVQGLIARSGPPTTPGG